MSLSVLVVDDSAVIRSVVRKALGMSGVDLAEVHEAGSGVEALRVLGERWIDIVLADLNMPEMSGVELVRAMAQDHVLATIPVVIVSSERDPSRIEELRRLGIRAYLKKPFRPESLRDTLHEVLGSGAPREQP
jgi:two-component system, chemotaxis family, chemotaxis protein CheY